MSSGHSSGERDKVLAELSLLHPKKIDLGLSRIESVLEKLGRPQDRLPPIIHVAGTNGKGSTIAFLRAMAEAQGLTCHVYISPHLVEFNERITLASKPIENDRLIEVIGRVRAANGSAPLSFFEAITAAALLAFSEVRADLAIIEVGLGGRYDATNVITPIMSAITPVDYDHAEFLGRDLAGIAREKAGIIKPHIPVILGRQLAVAAQAIGECAQNQSAPCSVSGEDFHIHREQGRLVFEDSHALMDLPLPALIGEHQIENAGQAIAIAKALQFSDKAIAKGLGTAIWPGRMQPLGEGYLADIVINRGGELWLDGGHNPHAARALASVMAEREALQSRPLILVMGILSNKDAGGFLDAFSGLASGLIAVEIEGHAALGRKTLCELAAYRGMDTHMALGLTDGLDAALNMGEGVLAHKQTAQDGHGPRILICGSLYLAGQVLALNAKS